MKIYTVAHREWGWRAGGRARVYEGPTFIKSISGWRPPPLCSKYILHAAPRPREIEKESLSLSLCVYVCVFERAAQSDTGVAIFQRRAVSRIKNSFHHHQKHAPWKCTQEQCASRVLFSSRVLLFPQSKCIQPALHAHKEQPLVWFLWLQFFLSVNAETDTLVYLKWWLKKNSVE